MCLQEQADLCILRKRSPGLLLDVEIEIELDLKRSWVLDDGDPVL
jgi:histidinol phosphatase-like enzyme